MFNDKLSTAKLYAINAHGDQRYGGEFPYSLHLQAVESVLLRFGIQNDTFRIVAWLHDVLEDTDRQYEEVETLFGFEVAQAVAALTEPKGGNRAWRHDQTYPRIKGNEIALTVKLADRIANVEAGGKKVGMYRKEHATFKRVLAGGTDIYALAQNGKAELAELWFHLDHLIAGIRWTEQDKLAEGRNKFVDELVNTVQKG